MTGESLGGFDGLRHTAGDRDVVVLDQDRIVETEAMVGTAATFHRIFLERTQTRCRLAGADDVRLGVCDQIGEFRRSRRNA